MVETLVAFAASVVVNLLVMRVAKRHLRALDHDLSGPQKFHHKAVPRIGGMGILLGVAAGLLLFGLAPSQDDRADDVWYIGWLLLACSLPAFGVDIVEDLTKRVIPSKRLLATALLGLLAAWLLGAVIRHTATPGMDMLVATTAGAYAFTLLVVVGKANAVNLIDGFNGLASMCVVIMMAAVAYVAFQVGDAVVLSLALAGIGATLVAPISWGSGFRNSPSCCWYATTVRFRPCFPCWCASTPSLRPCFLSTDGGCCAGILRASPTACTCIR
jgi:UDP-N-acetylmuramyl pentapeptide phosphotransferase/UDP-N-acetylglucosamine-1-phosphate transferase